MSSLTHRIYRVLLRWYVTTYRPPVLSYSGFFSPTITVVRDLTRYVLTAVFVVDPSDGKLVLSHIHITSRETGQTVTELY